MTKIISAVIISFTLVSIALSQSYSSDVNPFSGSFTLMLEGGTTVTKTDYNNSLPAFVGKISADYFLHTNSRVALGIKMFGGFGTLRANGGADTSVHNIASSIKTPVYFIGIGPELSVNLGKFCPYFFMGLSYLSFYPEDSTGTRLPRNKAGVYSKTELNYNFEFGVKYRLSRQFSINAAVTGHVSTHDYLDDLPNSISTGYHNDQFYTLTLGISYSFLESKESGNEEQVQEPVQVQQEIQKPVQDQDHDGVPDYLDKCPNTPSGVAVDKNGCPLDSDHDGVPDYLDKCSGTPSGVAVDKSGCPLDSDHDGVPDYLDKCPNTAPDVKVDSTGCPIVETKPQQVKPEVKPEIKPEVKSLPKKVNYGLTLFDAGNFDKQYGSLTASGERILDSLSQTLNSNPNSRWRIDGYIDNMGSDSLNKKVSLERALTVYYYLVSKGLQSTRFDVYGEGAQNPLSTDTTEEGRALNRRVTFTEIKEAAPVMKTTEGVKPSSNIITDTTAYNFSNDSFVEGAIYTDGKLFSIQLSSWLQIDKAEQRVALLKAAGHNAMIWKARIGNGYRYRVRVGFFKTKSDAQAYYQKYFAQ